MKIIVILLLNVLLIGCSADTSPNNAPNKESEMFSKGKKENYVIFSPMTGILMQNGKPLSNTKIVRRLRWNDNDDEGLVEEFTTDDDGHFSLPIHEEQLSLGISQFVAKAELEVITKGTSHELWYSTKFKPTIYSETDGPANNLVCDLNTETITVRADLSKISTRCRWENMPVSEL